MFNCQHNAYSNVFADLISLFRHTALLPTRRGRSPGSRSFFLGSQLFLPGGSLWLGQWHISQVHIQGVPTEPFVGSIDVLRVWRTALDSVAIRQSSALVLTSTVSNLSSLWLFDEGEGRSAHSLVHGVSSFYLPKADKRRPNWEFSYCRQTLPTAAAQLSIDFRNASLGQAARALCRSLIFDPLLKAQCALDLQVYYLFCLNDINVSGSLDAAYPVVVAYADFCQTLRRLSSWPGRHLCSKFPTYYPLPWIGVNCTVQCLFGRASESNNSVCVCELGYWGSQCSNECPGGANSPCNKHGACDSLSGTCTCDLNWRGDETCGECTPGWTGDDCSVGKAGHKLPTCSAFVGGHFTNFDGSHFNFFGVGEYWLLRAHRLRVQMRQIPCADGYSRCINAVGFIFYSNDRLVFHGPHQDDQQPVVWVNGKVAVFRSKRLEITGDVSLVLSSSTTYSLISETLKIFIDIRVIGTRVSFAGRIPEALCNSSTALCGNCDGNQNNDFNMSGEAVEESRWKVSPSESLFVHGYGQWKEEQVPTGSEFALSFRGVGASSDLIPHIFTGSHVTVELLFRLHAGGVNAGGVLFSYSLDTTLTVHIEDSVKIQIGAEVWDTNIHPESDAWNQIVLVYFRRTGTTTVYHINSRGTVSVPVSRTLASGLFVSNSIVAAGQWIPSREVGVLSESRGFVGLIDEVRIWNREFSLADVQASWAANIQSSAAFLASLWKFNEGQGVVVRDAVSSVHLYIPVIDNAPQWVFSYANVRIIPIAAVITFHNVSLRAHAENWCHEHIIASPLGQLCAANNSGSGQFYYRACMRTVATWNKVSTGIDVVVAFADSCQVSFNFSFWPARQMCNYAIFKTSRLSTWVGAACNVPCLFGQGSTAQYTCKCDPGFWAHGCTSVCPGGPVNFCNGKGTCSPDRGTCSCDLNWRGSRDCTLCTPGYHGRDCSVVISSPGRKRPITLSGGIGMYVTLEGVKFKLGLAGEFTAVVSARLGLSVNLRQVKVGGYVRLRCVAVSVPGSTIAIHSGIGAVGGVLVTVNGAKIRATGVTSLGVKGFVFRQTALNSYVITGPEGFQLIVYHRGIHLDVAISMDESLCRNTCGLLGRCNNAMPSNCSINSSLGSYNVSAMTQVILEKYARQFSVPVNKSLFNDVLKLSGESTIITGAGACLFFNGTSIVTSPLKIVSVSSHISMQFSVKAKAPLVHGGTIVSFALNETFAVSVNGTIRIHFGSRVVDTEILLRANVWSHISLVYGRQSGWLEFYMVTSSGTIQRRNFQIGSGAFPSGGSLAVALWVVTSSVELSVPGFVGWVDELSIWNRRLDPVVISESWTSNLEANIPGLSALWKFNEGSGLVARATVGKVDFVLPPPPWKAPVWYPSDANVTISEEFVATSENPSGVNSTSDLCSKLLLEGPLNEQCANATGQPLFYYQSCVEQVEATESLESVLVSSVSMATECQAALNLSTLPGQKLCKVVPGGRYDNWVGENCTERCFVGTFREGLCECSPGYWGDSCSEECLGGARNPCFGHGQCDTQTGQCKCDVNWRGNENCTACSVGWRGKFCSVAVAHHVSTNNSSKLCSITASGRVAGFDGSLYAFTSVGEFFMIKTHSIQAQVRQVPCESSSICLNAIGLLFDGFELSIHAPYERDESPLVHANGKLISVGEEPTDIMRRLEVVITPVSSTRYEVELADRVSLQVRFNGRHLSVEATISEQVCQTVEGLCGSCAASNVTQGNSSSECYGVGPKTVLGCMVNASAPDTDIDDFIKHNFDSSNSTVIVIDKVEHRETRLVYGGLYCLHFDFAAAISHRAVNPFIGDGFTIQLLTKSCDPLSCGGTLISYSSRVAFYISNHITIKVVIGSDVYDSGIPTEPNLWNQISVVFLRAELEMVVYVTNAAGLVQYKKFVVKLDPFVPNGTFAVGLWQPASGSIGVQPTGIFRGSLDEISIWKKPFDYAMIKGSWRLNIQSDVPSLASLWKLNEGQSSVVKDAVSGINLFFPKYPMEAPRWIFSDAAIGVATALNPNRANVTLKAIAHKACLTLLFEGHLYDSCHKLGNVTLQFYFRACLNVVIGSGDADQSLDIIVTVADVCQASLALQSWPAQFLCNAFQTRRFPYWIGEDCTIPCIFGTASNTSKNSCVCDSGYYGINCSEICPGGAQNSCHGNGECDVITGKCTCALNWRGDVNCSSCSPGWSGADCSVAVRDHVTASLGIGGFYPGGHVVAFDGTSLNLRLSGEYYLLYSVHLTLVVQVRLVSCFGKLSCVNSLAVQSSSHTLVLHGPYTSGAAIIWIDGQLVDLDLQPITTVTYGFALLKNAAGLFELVHPALHLKIRVNGRYLSLSVSASAEACKDSLGLLGSCSKPFMESLKSHYLNFSCSENNFNASQASRMANSSKYTGIANVTREAIAALVKSNLQVKTCHSLFLYRYKDNVEYREANAGYALYFDDTAVVSGTLVKAFQSNHITIELMFKTVRCGVIISYTKIKTLFVTCAGGIFVVHFGNQVYPTNINAELNAWNQINLVFSKNLGMLQFYYFSSVGLLHRQDILIGADAFVPVGRLALAGWQPSLDGSGMQTDAFFAGFIDQVRVWSRYFHPAIITQTWNRGIAVETEDMALAWKFNEGDGRFAVDTVTKTKLVLAAKPWKVPRWEYSGIRLQKSFYEAEIDFPFTNNTLKSRAEELCQKLILSGPLRTSCAALGPGVSTFYYRSCLRRIAVLGSLYASMEVVIAFSDYCQATQSLAVWPAKPLCNEFPGRNFPVWFGSNCNKLCVFGVKEDPNLCSCFRGYWDTDCSKVCPGGAAAPCNNNGVCDRLTGACRCHGNWNGTQDCGLCSEGWIGKDCSVAKVRLTPLQASHAFSFAGGHYVTFVGHCFTAVIVGEFYVIQVPNFAVQVRQVPCRAQSVCINAIGIRASTTVLSFHAPYEDNGLPILWVNGKLTALTGLLTTIGQAGLGIRLSIESPERYVIAWQENFKIYLQVEGRYLNFKLDIKNRYCLNSTGLLGACDNYTGNDFQLSPNVTIAAENLTQLEINTILIQQASVPSKERLVVLKYLHYQELHIATGAMHALLFNGSGASSNTLFRTFVDGVDIAVEVLFKPLDNGGTVFSYSKLHTFAVTINGTIKIHFRSRVYETGVHINIGRWSQISLVWHYANQLLEFYHFNFEGRIQRRAYVLTSNPFPPGGILSLGQWELSPGETELTLGVAFVGIVDEIRVWRTAFNPVVIQQNWRMNVLATHPGLTSLWKFNEGDGDVIFNLVSDEHFYLPRRPWPRPLWVFSDADIKTNLSKHPLEIHSHDEALVEEAESFCSELFHDAEVAWYTPCRTLKSELDFHFLVCVKDIVTTAKMSAALTAVVQFSDHCQAVLQLDSWPARVLCNKFPGARFPRWIGPQCDVECVFGTAHANDPKQCVCDAGFWGEDCSKVNTTARQFQKAYEVFNFEVVLVLFLRKALIGHSCRFFSEQVPANVVVGRDFICLTRSVIILFVCRCALEGCWRRAEGGVTVIPPLGSASVK